MSQLTLCSHTLYLAVKSRLLSRQPIFCHMHSLHPLSRAWDEKILCQFHEVLCTTGGVNADVLFSTHFSTTSSIQSWGPQEKESTLSMLIVGFEGKYSSSCLMYQKGSSHYKYVTFLCLPKHTTGSVHYQSPNWTELKIDTRKFWHDALLLPAEWTMDTRYKYIR